MAKRPALQFYPADWKNNANLRRCSEAARGVWLDLMCVFHDSDEYGLVRWPLEELARAAGAAMKLVRELVQKAVLKGAERDFGGYVHTPRHAGKDGEPVTLIAACEGPVWFSSRMVRDEWVRSTRGEGTRFQSGNQAAKGSNSVVDWHKFRRPVFEKTDGKCYHCGKFLDFSGPWNVDHLVPRSKGGPSTFENLVAACIPCNREKSDTMPNDFKRQGVRQGDDSGDGPISSSSSSPTVKEEVKPAVAGLCASFDDFWRDYPTDRNMPKKKARSVWDRLPEEKRKAAIAAIPGFRAYCRQNEWYRPIYADRFLSQEKFEGYAADPGIDAEAIERARDWADRRFKRGKYAEQPA